MDGGSEENRDSWEVREEEGVKVAGKTSTVRTEAQPDKVPGRSVTLVHRGRGTQ